MTRARMVGINHVALEVGDIGEALDFYGRFFEFGLRGRSESQAFIDTGDTYCSQVRTSQVCSGHLALTVRRF